MSGTPPHDPDAGPPLRGPDQLTADAIEALQRQLTRAVQRLCPVWLAHTRDDIVQAALIKLTRIAQGENTTAFTASYVWKVAFSMVVDEIRRHRRRGEETLTDAPAIDILPATASPDPERLAAGRQLGRAIRACLGGLAADRRLAVTLHLQGHSIAEAGGYLGWPGKRVANLTYRGLGDLRRCLAAKGYSS